jgi:hypothetical protein
MISSQNSLIINRDQSLHNNTNLPPSLVLKVGYLESLSKLASDARGWLEFWGSPVNLVIAVKVHKRTPRVII